MMLRMVILKVGHSNCRTTVDDARQAILPIAVAAESSFTARTGLHEIPPIALEVILSIADAVHSSFHAKTGLHEIPPQLQHRYQYHALVELGDGFSCSLNVHQVSS
jgi:hypothetical protein